MIGQWLPRRPPASQDVDLALLTAADVSRLDLGWQSLFTAEDLRQHVARFPGRSFWIPATREYAIGGWWRHRREIGSVLEIGVRGDHRARLVRAVIDGCAASGCPLVIYSDTSEVRHPRWYQEQGFELVQEILVYELHGLPATRWSGPARLSFEPVRVVPAAADLLAIDQQSFPWLWWNSVDEFENYLDQSHVRLYLGRDPDGVAVAYAGVTLYQGWGHIDRLAVLPARQGQGYGLETLTYCADQIYTTGARRLGLSTQADNNRSQELYERFGFRRTYRTDYKIYGHWLVDDAAERRRLVIAPGRGLNGN